MYKLKCNVTKKQLFSSCLLSAIAHAIMTNEYPDLSYEQSWDRDNYSKQFDEYRMTISFKDDYCVGAIRNNNSTGIYGVGIRSMLMESQFPPEAVKLLKEEALEYVLDYRNGLATPVISSLFWCNEENLLIISDNQNMLNQDIKALHPHLASTKQQIEYWREYYEMKSNHVMLLTDVHKMKLQRVHSPIHLTEAQKKMLPGGDINEECIESFAELNIVV